MPVPALVELHGRSRDGPTDRRDHTFRPPHPGQLHFDLESGSYPYNDSKREELHPMGVPLAVGLVEALPAAARVDGAVAFGTIVSKLTVLTENSAARLAVDDEQSSSTRSSRSFSSSESSST